MGHDRENRINLYERKILRRILGPINDNGTWRIRYNKEIYTLYGDPELSTVIKLRRLQSAGHVQRMESQSVPRMVMAGLMVGKRPEGKPKKRWMDAVKEDSYQILKGRNSELKAQDRDDGGRESRRPRTALGCSAIDDDDNTSSPPQRLVACSGTALAFFINTKSVFGRCLLHVIGQLVFVGYRQPLHKFHTGLQLRSSQNIHTSSHDGDTRSISGQIN
jgi:hypothetical protein